MPLSAPSWFTLSPSTNWFNVLGSATLTAFIFQLATGVFLAMSYVPAPNDAYKSLQYIVNTSLFGHFIRGVHYWGASAMILLDFLALPVCSSPGLKYSRS